MAGPDRGVILDPIDLGKAIGNGDNERGLGRMAALATWRLGKPSTASS
jgi:hypothetical protein